MNLNGSVTSTSLHMITLWSVVHWKYLFVGLSAIQKYENTQRNRFQDGTIVYQKSFSNYSCLSRLRFLSFSFFWYAQGSNIGKPKDFTLLTKCTCKVRKNFNLKSCTTFGQDVSGPSRVQILGSRNIQDGGSKNEELSESCLDTITNGDVKEVQQMLEEERARDVEVESHPDLERMIKTCENSTLTDIMFEDVDADRWGFNLSGSLGSTSQVNFKPQKKKRRAREEVEDVAKKKGVGGSTET